MDDQLIMEESTPRSRTTIMNNHLFEKTREQLTQTADPVGTPYYIAPEIWKHKSYSKASDIWALGVILYELINLKKPFPANDKKELQNKVLN